MMFLRHHKVPLKVPTAARVGGGAVFVVIARAPSLAARIDSAAKIKATAPRGARTESSALSGAAPSPEPKGGTQSVFFVTCKEKQHVAANGPPPFYVNARDAQLLEETASFSPMRSAASSLQQPRKLAAQHALDPHCAASPRVLSSAWASKRA